MRRAAIVGVLLCSFGAWAMDYMFGPERYVSVYSFVPQLDRVGSVATPQITYSIGGIGKVKAILFYVDEVHTPGTVALNLSTFDPQTGIDGGVGATSIPVTAPGWQEWPVVPAIALSPNRLLVEVQPSPGVEVTLRHLMKTQPQTDSQLGYEAVPARVGVFASDNVRTATGLVRLDQEVDRFADLSGCGPSEQDAIAGHPYVNAREIPIGSGVTQQFFWPYLGRPFTTPGRPQGATQGLVQGDINNPPLDVALLTPDGSYSAASGSYFINFSTNAPPSNAVGDGGTSEVFAVIVTSDGGTATIRVFDTGAVPLGPCHPAVRASFGGHQARALGQPNGSDYAVRIQPTELDFKLRDDDHDLFAVPDSGAWRRGGVDVGLGDDCDDSRPYVHPGAFEWCDGIDDDCDGLIDAADEMTEYDRPLCELSYGVCSGKARVKNECVGGQWQACSAASYGPLYSPFGETSCNGLDENCNGMIDELTSGAMCPFQRGVCAGSTQLVCDFSAGCTASEYGPDYEPTETRCDGLDNDCDGLGDESCVVDAGTSDAGARPTIIEAVDPEAGKVAATACGCGASPAGLFALLALAALHRRRPSRSR